MPRCLTCNYCSETDSGPKREFIWDDEEKGFFCKSCEEAFGEATASYYDDEEELDGADFLEFEFVEEPQDEASERLPEPVSSPSSEP